MDKENIPSIQGFYFTGKNSGWKGGNEIVIKLQNRAFNNIISYLLRIKSW